MTSQRAASQLNKSLVVDIAGTTPANTPVISILLNQPARPAFPAYQLGYNVAANVRILSQRVPPLPANRQGSPHPYHMLAENNLHPVLFQIEPVPNTLVGVQVPLLVDENTGAVETSSTGRPLRYFWHMPRWIALDVSGMEMELWLRLDPRVGMRDILDRVNTGNQPMPAPNVFNMRRNRFRLSIMALSQNTGRQMPSASEVEMIGSLTREQILLNTAMAVDLANNRLLKPVLAYDRRILGYVDSGLMIDHFLVGFAQPIPIPSHRQQVTLALRQRLQTLTLLRGLGNNAVAFRSLPVNLQPGWWNERRPANSQVGRIVDIDNRTHEEFVQGLFAQFPVPNTARRTTRGRRQQQQQQPASAAHPAANDAAAPAAPMPIDPRLLVAQSAFVFAGLMRADLPTEEEELRLQVRTPNGIIHAYVEDVHQALYR